MGVVKLPVDAVTRAGKKPTVKTPLVEAETYRFKNDGDTMLRVTTGEATTKVKIIIQKKVDGQLVVQREVELAKKETKEFGPFPLSEYNNEEEEVEFMVTVGAEVSVEVKKLS